MTSVCVPRIAFETMQCVRFPYIHYVDCINIQCHCVIDVFYIFGTTLMNIFLWRYKGRFTRCIPFEYEKAGL